jgi:hypothetical protein
MYHTNPTSRRPVSQAMQRSQSTPNVSVKPAQQQLQRPRRTKTSIDFLAVSPPPRHVSHREKGVDPFNLGGFFPSGLRESDQEPSGWWRDEGPEEGSEELAGELMMVDNDGGLLGSQPVLFGREDQPLAAEAVIKREDKLGVQTVCAHFLFSYSIE